MGLRDALWLAPMTAPVLAHSGRTTALNAATCCASLSSIAPVHQAYGLVADVPVSLSTDQKAGVRVPPGAPRSKPVSSREDPAVLRRSVSCETRMVSEVGD